MSKICLKSIDTFRDAISSTGFGYTGQRYDSEIGLYNYRARYYSPALGRFLQPDPIGFAGGMNFYAYVNNDAVNLVDPLGLEPPCKGGISKNNTNEVDDWINQQKQSVIDSIQQTEKGPLGRALEHFSKSVSETNHSFYGGAESMKLFNSDNTPGKVQARQDAFQQSQRNNKVIPVNQNYPTVPYSPQSRPEIFNPFRAFPSEVRYMGGVNYV